MTGSGGGTPGLDLACDRPGEGRHLAGDRRGDQARVLAGGHEPPGGGTEAAPAPPGGTGPAAPEARAAVARATAVATRFVFLRAATSRWKRAQSRSCAFQ